MPGERINIATLDIETRELVKKATQAREAIQGIKDEQAALKQSGQENSAQFVRNQAELKRLSGVYRECEKAIISQVDAAGKLKSANEAVALAVDKVNATEQDLRDNNKQLLALRRQINIADADGARQIALINAKLDENNAAIKNNVSGYEKQKIGIGQYKEQVIEAYKAIQKEEQELRELNAELKIHAATLDKNSDEYKVLNNQIQANNRQLNQYESSMEAARGETEGFGGAADLASGGLGNFVQKAKEAGGAGNLIKSTFADIKGGLLNMASSAQAFISTGIGAAVVGLTAGFAAGKALFDYNRGLQEMNKELKAFGVNKGDISAVRSEVMATAEVFNKEFSEIATTVNAVSKAYNISFSEANRRVAEGLNNLPLEKQNEYLEQVSEYAPLLAQAGYSVEQFNNIVNTGFELGIYTDKLPDALKEADLSLREQTKSTRDALVNAFGASFTDDILKRVRTGEATTAQALNEIAAKAKAANLTQQQQAQLTADVFRGAGEDAGGAGQIFEAVNQAATKSIDNTNSAQLDLLDSTERLNKAQANLFEIEGFGDVWTSVKASATGAMADILEYLGDLKKDLQPIIDVVGFVLVAAFAGLKNTVNIAFAVIGGVFRELSNQVGSFVSFFKAIFTGDFKGALNVVRDYFVNLGNNVSNVFGNIKNSILSTVQSIVSAISPVLNALGVDVDRLNKSLDSMKSKTVEVKKQETTVTKNKTVADVDPNAAANAKAAADAAKKAAAEREKADKEAADKRQRYLDADVQKQKDALALFEAQQGIKKRSTEEEAVYQQEVSNKKLAIIESEYRAGKQSKAAYETAKINLTNETFLREANIAIAAAEREVKTFKETNDKKKEDLKLFTTEQFNQKVIENNQLADLERKAAFVKKITGQVTQQEYNDAINQINADNRAKNDEVRAVQAENEKVKLLQEAENKRIDAEVAATTELEQRQVRLNNQYEVDIAAAKAKGQSIALIEKQYKDESAKIEQEKQQAKVAIASGVLSAYTSVIGKESAAGKAAAIAQALINTYQGIAAGVKLGWPAMIPAIAAASATGFEAVRNIQKTKTPKAERGALFNIGGKRHSEGGTLFTGADGTQFEAERGELIGVMNRNAAAHFMAFNNSFPAGAGNTSSNYFETGGLVNRTPQQITNISQLGINVSELAASIAEANAQLPNPVVQVDDVRRAGGKQAFVKGMSEY